jgi:tetratricopeptide (TPR) repeat protein
MRLLQLVPQAQQFRDSLKRRTLRCGVLLCIAICSSGYLLAQTAQQYIKNGDRQAAANQYQQAVKSYLSATRLQPDNADAYGKLASTYEKLNMLNESAAASSKAAEIYEKQADTLLNGAIVSNGGQAEKQHANVPEGATIYPIKTIYTKCVQDASLAVQTVWKADYVCMKDKFGDWSCPTDSTAERLEYKLIQKK